ncbi:ATP-binding protein [Streptomyces sp. NPDC053048]|uniref:ATP-binding protein n=1 Tax=Streptomyces sp. NPDC053048 TaxID=3365694 RepID=UPI0037CFAD79
MTSCGCPRATTARGRTATLDAILHASRHDWGVALGLSTTHFAAIRFDAGPCSPARTRGFLRRTLAGWDLADYADDATTVTAELVANAIRHALRRPGRPAPGREPATAWLALLCKEHALVCAVADPSPALPAAREADGLAETGRGLQIVAALSEAWGCSPPHATGKTVWARITTG